MVPLYIVEPERGFSRLDQFRPISLPRSLGDVHCPLPRNGSGGRELFNVCEDETGYRRVGQKKIAATDANDMDALQEWFCYRSLSRRSGGGSGTLRVKQPDSRWR